MARLTARRRAAARELAVPRARGLGDCGGLGLRLGMAAEILFSADGGGVNVRLRLATISMLPTKVTGEAKQLLYRILNVVTCLLYSLSLSWISEPSY